jgi:hypothetical protein
MLMRSGTPTLPPDAPHPASLTASPRISNRYWKLLEIALTPTKHSLDPISNRYENTQFSAVCTGAPVRARSALDCGSSATAEFAKCPRIHTERAQCALERALPKSALHPIAHAPSGQRLSPLPVEAGSPPSRSARLPFALRHTHNCAGLRLSHAQPAPTGSSFVMLGPSTIRPLITFVARRRTACAAGYSTLQRHASRHTSNRHWKGLEIAVTHTKQSPDPFLIDNENTPFRTPFFLSPQRTNVPQCAACASAWSVKPQLRAVAEVDGFDGGGGAVFENGLAVDVRLAAAQFPDGERDGAEQEGDEQPVHRFDEGPMLDCG